MKLIFALIITLQHAFLFAMDNENMINSGAYSSRCTSLMQERNEKIHHIQKLKSLKKKTLSLKNKSEKKRPTAVKRLELSLLEIENNLRLSEMRLKNMEENIIRQGCPGIRL